MRICIVSPGHPANNPRMVRNADALAAAGHEVTVVSPRFDPVWAALEEEIISRAAWTYVPVDLVRTERGRRLWRKARIVRRISFAVASRIGSGFFDARGIPYGFPQLVRAARQVNADVYLAQQQPALAIVFAAIGGRAAPVVFDAEDLLSETGTAEAKIHDRIERRYIRRCGLVMTMSRAASEHLAAKHGLREEPLILHNVPRLAERLGVNPPAVRLANQPPTVYWFGQTLGAASRAEQIIRAMPLVRTPFRFVLRAQPTPDYLSTIRKAAIENQCSDRVELLPIVPPAEMVPQAARHDVLFGSQPASSIYYQCAIGNKVFTGMMAGLALLLSESTAHRKLLADFPGLGECVGDQSETDVARVLNLWFSDRSRLIAAQEKSWNVAGDSLNWDHESQALVGQIARLASGGKAKVSS